MYFNAPSPEPNHRFTHPKETASIALVSRAATNVKANGTAIQIRMNANICANVIESVNAGHNFSATEAYKAFAANNPTTKPSKDANCFTKPFIKPNTAPIPTMTSITISTVVMQPVCC